MTLASKGALIDIALLLSSTLLLVWVLSLAFAPPQKVRRATPAMSAVGVVAQASGEVRTRTAGSLAWTKLRSADRLYAGDAIFTTTHGTATLHLKSVANSFSEILLQPRTLVVVQGLSAAHTPSMELVRGQAEASTTTSPLVVHTADRAIEVAGRSKARLQVDRRHKGTLTVSTGQANVQDPKAQSGTVQKIERGQRLALGPGMNSTAEAELILLTPAQRVVLAPGQPLHFLWSKTAGPALFELSPDADFSFITQRHEVKGGELYMVVPRAGQYFWRVSQGMHSAKERIDIVFADAPRIAEPLPQSTVDLSTERGLTITWSSQHAPAPYSVQIASAADTEFRTPLFSSSTNDTRLYISRGHGSLAHERTLCVRVRPERFSNLWSSTRCFRVMLKPVLRAPELFAPENDNIPRRKQGGWNWYNLIGGLAHAQTPVNSARVLLRWEELPGATTYILEVATDSKFHDIVLSQSTASTYRRFSPPSLRTYYWRVRAVDSQGRLGETSSVRTIILNVPRPILSAPQDAATIAWTEGKPHVTFQWVSRPPASAYIVEISQHPSFDTVLTTRTIASSSKTTIQETTFSLKKGGGYFWRVFGLSATKERGLPSTARSFSISTTIPQPLVAELSTTSSLAEGRLHTTLELAWSRSPSRSYEVQVAHDPEFAADPRFTPEADLETHRIRATRLSVDLPGAGRWYWRVRGIREDTRWSSSATIDIKPPTPEPLSPEAHALIEREVEHGVLVAIEFRWKTVPDVDGYVLTVQPQGKRSHWPAHTYDIAAAIGSTETEAEAHHSVELDPGTYRWHINAHGGDVSSSASNDLQFELKTHAPKKEDIAPLLTLKPKPIPTPDPTPISHASPQLPMMFLAPQLGARRTNKGNLTPVLTVSAALPATRLLWMISELSYVLENPEQRAMASASFGGLVLLMPSHTPVGLGLQGGVTANVTWKTKDIRFVPGLHAALSLEFRHSHGNFFTQLDYRLEAGAIAQQSRASNSLALALGYRIGLQHSSTANP